MKDNEKNQNPAEEKDFEKIIKNADLKSIYSARRKFLTDFMKQSSIAALVFEDTEERRDPSIRYLTGHPSDAALILSQSGECILVPWDENLAALKANADRIIPLTSYGRSYLEAIKSALKLLDVPSSSAVELSPKIPYPVFLKYVEELSSWDILCREHSGHEYAEKLRAKKDYYEIACTRKACKINSDMTDEIEIMLRNGKIKTETDVGLYVERTLRERGCERTGFDTLAAGPSRSYAIHAFPGYTSSQWGSQGLSILDYGVVIEGYTSDCTITVARGPLSTEQKKITELVQKAFDECLPLYKAGLSLKNAAVKAQSVFAKAKRSMPHGLGHGIGLEIHENPRTSLNVDEKEVFEEGNIITLEPGLYDPDEGGCRLENDILILKEGNEVLTNSRIIRL